LALPIQVLLLVDQRFNLVENGLIRRALDHVSPRSRLY
jgi:hypothetical protein